jgi:hypothetical protein
MICSVDRKVFEPQELMMNRRDLLRGAAALAAAGLVRPSRSLGLLEPSPSISITVNPNSITGAIPSTFMGLGYEISSAAAGGPLVSGSPVYEQLVRTLGRDGVIRIGGNTSDYSSFNPSGQSIAKSKSSVINQSNLDALGAFLRATGWKLIWGLNLGEGSEQDAIAEAEAVTKIAGGQLIAFEIGNEPDLFLHEGHRKNSYSYEDYLGEYRRFKRAIREHLPNAPFAGPDAAVNMDWVKQFAADEGSDLKLLTCHYYREGQNPSSTLAKLLHPDPALLNRLKNAHEAGEAAHLPYRICETNSFSGGGRPGVSDTFGAALWVLDFMYTLASNHAAGLNIETGINQLDFISSYSPLKGDAATGYSVGADYYGMLAFAQAGLGNLVAADYAAAGLELTAYAVTQNSGDVTVTVLNKEPSRDIHLSIQIGPHYTHARALWLRAPHLDSKDGVTLGGASVAADGSWKPKPPEKLPVRAGKCEFLLPAASAVVLTFAL